MSEFSPYILHNYLVSIFPFLTAYLVGSIYATPEIGTYSNYAGVILILVGFFCILIHNIISHNVGNEHQDIIAMKNNYDDFSSLRESLAFPNNKRNIESFTNVANSNRSKKVWQ